MKTKSTSTDDSTKLMLLRDDNIDAFDDIFHKYYKPLFAYACRFVCTEDAEDIVQNLLLWLWENRSNILINTSLHSYLFRSIYYRCVSSIDSGLAKKRLENRYWEMMSDCIGTDVEKYELEYLIDKVREALELLPPTYREVIIMKKFGGMNYNEIVDKVGCFK
jgi:RNA polymerase sigma-70 factor (ECF subfamily)